MKIIIIGAKGFIGSNAVKYFENTLAWEVWSCGVEVDYTAARYSQIDATNSDFSDLFRNNIFDVCLNCSGAASVPDSLINPQRDFLLNTYNVFKILDAVRKYNSTCKVINISSAAVYGNPASLPIRESSPLAPISPYGQHKLMSETICKEFFDYYGVGTCSLRVFSAYGEGLKKQILWDLSKKMQKQSVIKLFGDGSETRDFIYIRDIIRAIELIIENAAFRGESINVANGQEVRISHLVDIFRTLTQWEGEVNFSGQVREGDPKNWRADISVIKSYGYKPSVPFEEGADKYLTWIAGNA